MIVDCLSCGEPFEGVWPVAELQDREDQPVAALTCPNPDCGATHDYEYPGWSYITEAG